MVRQDFSFNVAESATLGSIHWRSRRVGRGLKLPSTLYARKQDLVRDAIFDAAIDLFVRDGFEETTLENIAKFAGVSPRTLYRYFATRDELVAHQVMGYGKKLVESVEGCSGTLSPLETVRHAAVDATAWNIAQHRTREIITISSNHASVRQAHQSVIAGIQERLAEAFAARSRSASKDDLRPRIYASSTLMIVQSALSLWYHGVAVDPSAAVKQVITQLGRLFCEG